MSKVFIKNTTRVSRHVREISLLTNTPVCIMCANAIGLPNTYLYLHKVTYILPIRRIHILATYLLIIPKKFLVLAGFTKNRNSPE